MFFFPTEVNFHFYFNTYFFSSVSTTFYFRSFQPRFYEFIKFRLDEFGGGFSKVKDFNNFTSLSFPTSFFNPSYFELQTAWPSFLHKKNEYFEDFDIFFVNYNMIFFNQFLTHSLHENFVNPPAYNDYYPLLKELITYNPNFLEQLNFSFFKGFKPMLHSSESYIIGDVADITANADPDDIIEDPEEDYDLIEYSESLSGLYDGMDTEALETIFQPRIFKTYFLYSRHVNKLNFSTSHFFNFEDFRVDFPFQGKNPQVYAWFSDFDHLQLSPIENPFLIQLFNPIFRGSSIPFSAPNNFEDDFFTNAYIFKISEENWEVEREEWDFEKSPARSVRFMNSSVINGSSHLFFRFVPSSLFGKRVKFSYAFYKNLFALFYLAERGKHYFSGAYKTNQRLVYFPFFNQFRFITLLNATTRLL